MSGNKDNENRAKIIWSRRHRIGEAKKDVILKYEAASLSR